MVISFLISIVCGSTDKQASLPNQLGNKLFLEITSPRLKGIKRKLISLSSQPLALASSRAAAALIARSVARRTSRARRRLVYVRPHMTITKPKKRQKEEGGK